MLGPDLRLCANSSTLLSLSLSLSLCLLSRIFCLSGNCREKARPINKEHRREREREMGRYIVDDNTYKVTEARRRYPYFFRLSPSANPERGVTSGSAETHFPHRRVSKLSRCVEQKTERTTNYPPLSSVPVRVFGVMNPAVLRYRREFIKIHETSFHASARDSSRNFAERMRWTRGRRKGEREREREKEKKKRTHLVVGLSGEDAAYSFHLFIYQLFPPSLQLIHNLLNS